MIEQIYSTLCSGVWRIRQPIRNPDSDRLFSLRYGDNHTLTVNGNTFTYDTSSLIAKRWFYPRYHGGLLHEPVVSHAFLRELSSSDVFFDIGSHVGYFAGLAAPFCSCVHAFEMDPELTSIISSHFTDCSSTDVSVVTSAVGDAAGEFVSFEPHITDNLSTNAVTNNHSDKVSSYRTPTVTIDNYCNEAGVSPDRRCSDKPIP